MTMRLVACLKQDSLLNAIKCSVTFKKPLDSDTVSRLKVGYKEEFIYGFEDLFETKHYNQSSVVHRQVRGFTIISKRITESNTGAGHSWCPRKLYDVTFSKRQMDEELLRTVPQILEKLLQIDQSSLSEIRPANLRLIGMCRDYSLLFLSFLRYKGIPVRLRVGFANYFESELMYEDHWLIEYYDREKQQWVRVDAQLDDTQKVHFGVTFDTEDMPVDAGYLLGGQAWSLCRLGERHQEDIGRFVNQLFATPEDPPTWSSRIDLPTVASDVPNSRVFIRPFNSITGTSGATILEGIIMSGSCQYQ